MDRRKFIKNSIYSSAALSMSPIISSCSSFEHKPKYFRATWIAPDNEVESKFKDVFQWLKDNNWDNYIQRELGLSLPAEYSIDELASVNLSVDREKKGLDDFGGSKWIEPGIPSKSLLYHLMASPRIQSKLIKSYPSIELLDSIENYIFDIADWDESEISRRDTYFMVLAYEYRPAFKTPVSRAGDKMAQFVFSKSGVARIGDQPENYDAANRCFTNKPIDNKKTKNVAVSPSRYGLFEVELVKADSDQIKLMNTTTKEYIRKILFHEYRYFISPIRKIYNTAERDIYYSQYHRNEKLRALSQYSYDGDEIELRPSNLDFSRPPFVRVSSTRSDGMTYPYHNSDLEMVKLETAGKSSVLLIPASVSMVREAKQDGERILVKVPEQFEKKNTHTNRRYAALKLPNEDGNEVSNVILSDIWGRQFGKRVYGIKAPKNAPQFLNIKFSYNESKDELEHIGGQIDNLSEEGFEGKIRRGGYFAQVFEDSICDGCVTAEIHTKTSNKKEIYTNKKVFPALSFVTAPDFFPLVDSNDIRSVFPDDDHFFEGGTLNLSTVRMRGNPHIIDPCTGRQAFAETYSEDRSFDTNLAVISLNHESDKYSTDPQVEKATQRRFETDIDEPFSSRVNRDYHATSYLPDTGTGVFYPAWDITYSNNSPKSSNHFLATIGLGSPFPEDMKLCAAANGMWPVTSPDAGRTFQGSLDYLYGKRPNSSIPLLDEEIGYHKHSPYVAQHRGQESHGWDGEQGPFFQFKKRGLFINYTDIARADYMLNLIRGPGFDMSNLREIKVSEIIYRMECLENCIDALESKKVWKTDLWLVSATKVEDWKAGATHKVLPKNEINYFDDCYMRQDDRLTGEGYLYVFAKVPKNTNNRDSTLDERDESLKRRIIECIQVWVCQSSSKLTAIKKINLKNSNQEKWYSETVQ